MRSWELLRKSEITSYLGLRCTVRSTRSRFLFLDIVFACVLYRRPDHAGIMLEAGTNVEVGINRAKVTFP